MRAEKRLMLMLVAIAFPWGVLAGEVKENPWAKRICAEDPALQCLQVTQGDTWESLFPDEELRQVAYLFNRQNVQLEPGQVVAVPPTTDRWQLSPLPLERSDGFSGVHVELSLLAGAEYVNGQLVQWFLAGGGADLCLKRGRMVNCRTPTGIFTVPAWAYSGPNRRSSVYPEGCIGTQCAPMPYFMMTDIKKSNGDYMGVGMHEGGVRGSNPSHQCIRLQGEFARYLNLKYQGKSLTVEITQS